jgi:hypothetical protein
MTARAKNKAVAVGRSKALTVVKPALALIKPDKDAAEIGELFCNARGSLIDSVRFAIECGRRLIAKKAQLKEQFGHGSWLPWLADNADVLGFTTRQTASRLMAWQRVL